VDITIKMTMQDGLTIIFGTQLSHKTGMIIADFRLRIEKSNLNPEDKRQAIQDRVHRF